MIERHMARNAALVLIVALACPGTAFAQKSVGACQLFVNGKCANAAGTWTASRNGQSESEVTRTLRIASNQGSGKAASSFVLEVARATGSYTRIEGEIQFNNSKRSINPILAQ